MTLHDRIAASSNADRRRTRRGRLQTVACCLAVFFCATVAEGQSPPPSTTAPAAAESAQSQNGTASTADELFAEGLQRLKKGEHKAACEKFEESEKLAIRVQTVCNIATCELGQKHYAAAWPKLQECLLKLDKKDEGYSVAADNKAFMEGFVGRLQLSLPAAAPPGMTVALDDQPLGANDLVAEIVVGPGDHRIVVTAPGYEPHVWTVTAISKKTLPVAIELGKPLAPPDKTSEPVKTALPPLKASEPVKTALPVTTPGPAPPGFFWQHRASLATLGAGVALAAVGTGLALDIVGSRYHDYIQSCQGPEGCSKLGKEALEAEGNAVNALFPIAGLAALTAVGLFIFAEGGPKAHPTTQAHVTVGPTGVSLTVRR